MLANWAHHVSFQHALARYLCYRIWSNGYVKGQRTTIWGPLMRARLEGVREVGRAYCKAADFYIRGIACIRDNSIQFRLVLYFWARSAWSCHPARCCINSVNFESIVYTSVVATVKSFCIVLLCHNFVF